MIIPNLDTGVPCGDPNNVDPKRHKGILKAIGENAHDHSQLPPSRWLRACCMLQQREKREMKAIGKATEAVREPLKAYLYNNELKKPPKVTNSISTNITFGGA